MASIPSKVSDRLSAGIKKFQPVLSSAQARDVNESDTVIIVTDMLSDVFGFDKYAEVTSENSIRGTFCDLATKLDGKLQCLFEVKAIGQELKDAYVKQAIDYAANQGVDWVVLTNGLLWRIYKVLFAKPIDQELLCEINFLSLQARDADSLDQLYLLTKEACNKSVLGDYFDQKQALSRFSIAATILSDPILTVLRREIRKLSPDVRVDVDQIKAVIENEVLKRDVVEGEKADAARKKIARAINRTRAKSAKEEEPTVPAPPLPALSLPRDVPILPPPQPPQAQPPQPSA
jgi:predicted type IV restriction endonuclease